MTVRRPLTDSRSADVTFMGIYVDYTPAVVGSSYDPLGALGIFGI